MNRTEKLIPSTSQKSFYGKAVVLYREDGIYLRSYNTLVCHIDNNGAFSRLWSGWSATTAKHMNSFRNM